VIIRFIVHNDFLGHLSDKPVIQQLGSLIPWRKYSVKKMGQIFGLGDRERSADFEFPAKTVSF
jgi:hypothetical protein